ncbi:hypothetical protein N566_17615 [Streptomycetaceae bacterium MP113-05]|nr:hypothetical protein N566_17615 [Streptomycetaceae bacterium MP113-05]
MSAVLREGFAAGADRGEVFVDGLGDEPFEADRTLSPDLVGDLARVALLAEGGEENEACHLGTAGGIVGDVPFGVPAPSAAIVMFAAYERSRVTELSVRVAEGDTDRAVVERLWLMFCHDMSEFQDVFPAPDGTFRSDRLHSAFDDPDWRAYLTTSGEHPVGFAFVRALTGPVRVLNSFFVVRGARRAGIGLRAVKQVLARHPGPWEVAFQDANADAVRFWRRVATEVAGADWTEERRPVPDRPEVPPDVWISYSVPARPGTRD